MKKTYANAMLIFVSIIWGGGFIATSTALETFPPFYIMMIRFMGAAILPLMISWKYLCKMERSTICKGLLAGVFLFLAFAFQTFGLQYTTPSKNAFLTASNVVFVPYLLWLLMKRKPTRKESIASCICIIGISLLTMRLDALTLNIGDVLSLICAVFFAIHIITLERYSSHMNVFAMTALQMLSAGIISTLCAFCFERPPAVVESNAIGSLFFLIFGSTMLAYFLQTYAQKFTTANSASLILSMEALWASIFSFLFFHEIMSFPMLVGATFIFSSIMYIEYRPKKKNS